MTYATIGPLSSGHQDTADVVHDLAFELNRLAKRDCTDPERRTRANQAAAAALDLLAAEAPDATKMEAFLHEQAPDIFSEYCPPYTHYGSHPGAALDFGIWPDIDSLMEAARFNGGVLRLSAGDPWPHWSKMPKDVDYVVEVNDHGNVALYDARSQKLLWDCV